MSDLINYKGFKILQPMPTNLGGEALANNFKWLDMTSTPHAYNNTTPVVGFTTQYDLAGNKMYERELHAETRSSLYQPFDEKGYAQGGYDSLDRLRKVLRGELSSNGGYSAAGGGGITQAIALPNTDEERKYLLDGLGNWEQSDYIPVGGEPTVDLRQHNKLNQITSRKEEAKVLFVYDANGNLKDDGVLLYDYDALNRLMQVRRKSNGQTIGQYAYDAQNRRARKTVSNGGLSGNIPSGTIDFIYKDWQVVEERTGSTVNKQYVWGEYIDECIQLRTYVASGAGSWAAGSYYPLQDLLYRTKALTDTSGDIVEAYDYDPYGNTLIFSAAGTGGSWWADDAVQANYAVCNVLYAGYRYDAESKTYQVRNRQYNPGLGRWVQRDPIGFEGEDWNLYCFVADNPLRWIDPLGLYCSGNNGVVNCNQSASHNSPSDRYYPRITPEDLLPPLPKAGSIPPQVLTKPDPNRVIVDPITNRRYRMCSRSQCIESIENRTYGSLPCGVVCIQAGPGLDRLSCIICCIIEAGFRKAWESLECDSCYNA